MNYEQLNNAFNTRVKQAQEEYKRSFLNNYDLNNFIMKEEIWVRNNLTFTYSKKPENVLLKINPYNKIVKYNVESYGAAIEREYILLPKYLALKRLHIHASHLDKGDLLIKVFMNYAETFALNEITEQILDNSSPSRRNELNAHLQQMIRKFLSYQFLVVD